VAVIDLAGIRNSSRRGTARGFATDPAPQHASALVFAAGRGTRPPAR
jgi:hypothetical protein